MNKQDFSIAGLTCAHCVGAVTEEVRALDGVTAVEVDLVAGGTSTLRVESTAPAAGELIAAALDEAGDYALAGPRDLPLA